MIKEIQSTLEGHKMARRDVGRDLVGQKDTFGFSILFSELSHTTLRPQSIANAFKLHDILERQNNYGDERLKDRSLAYPFWGRKFEEEYSGVMVDIQKDLLNTYGESGREKAMRIRHDLENWFKVNWACEQYMSGRKNYFELSEKEQEIVRPILESNNKGKTYRETVDKPWLRVVMMVFADANEELVERNIAGITGATLLTQLSEDFANIRRDRRVGKESFFTMHEDKTFTARTKILTDQAHEYFVMMDVSKAKETLMKTVWFMRSMAVYAKARGNGDNWREMPFYDACNAFEDRKLSYGIN